MKKRLIALFEAVVSQYNTDNNFNFVMYHGDIFTNEIFVKDGNNWVLTNEFTTYPAFMLGTSEITTNFANYSLGRGSVNVSAACVFQRRTTTQPIEESQYELAIFKMIKILNSLDKIKKGSFMAILPSLQCGFFDNPENVIVTAQFDLSFNINDVYPNCC